MGPRTGTTRNLRGRTDLEHHPHHPGRALQPEKASITESSGTMNISPEPETPTPTGGRDVNDHPDVQPSSATAPTSIVSSPELEHLLFRLGRALRRITYPHCSKEASAIDGAGFWQLAILHEHGALRPSDLANILSLDISTVSRQLKQLESNGLVTRKVHEQDARAYLIIISETGERVLDEIIKLRQQTIAEVVAKWPKSEVRTLMNLVDKLTLGIEKQIGQRHPT